MSDQAGTTRDYVSEYLNLGGNNFRFIDTAGLRETTDKIERIGIDRTIQISSKAFFKILVVNPMQTREEDYKFLGDEEFDLLVVTHRDVRTNFNLNKLTFSKFKLKKKGKHPTTSTETRFPVKTFNTFSFIFSDCL